MKVANLLIATLMVACSLLPGATWAGDREIDPSDIPAEERDPPAYYEMIDGFKTPFADGGYSMWGDWCAKSYQAKWSTLGGWPDQLVGYVEFSQDGKMFVTDDHGGILYEIPYQELETFTDRKRSIQWSAYLKLGHEIPGFSGPYLMVRLGEYTHEMGGFSCQGEIISCPSYDDFERSRKSQLILDNCHLARVFDPPNSYEKMKDLEKKQ